MPSSSSSSAQRARQALADQLRELREDAGLTGKALAAAAGWHGVSKVSKIEHGVRSASAEDVRTWCRACGASEARTEKLLAVQRAMAGMWITYRRLNRAGLKRAQESVRSRFEDARHIRAYQSKIVPGLLQTAAYTTVMLEVSRDQQGVTRDDVAEAVAERMDRQSVLTTGGRRFAFLVEEAVLRHRVCDAETMRDQLRHLLEVMRLPSVGFGVIPQAADRRRVLPHEGFAVYDSELVSVELVSGYLTITQSDEIAMYLREFTDLASIAAYGTAARELIYQAIDALE